MDPITGKARVEIQGKKYTIRFDWEAIAEVNHVHGDNPNLFDPIVVASVAAIGMKKYHPDMTAERIRELSPPLVPFASAVQKALQWALLGPEEPTKAQKKRRSRIRDGLRRLFGLRAGTESIPGPSGD